MKVKTKVFPARKIITMAPEHPFARAVAVRNGRVLAVGDPGEIRHWLDLSAFGPYEVDTTLEDKILLPGLVDAHTHVELQALIYSGHFVAQIPWPRPEGGFYPVFSTKQEVLDRLRELDRTLPPGEALYAAAYDENKTGAFLHLDELDSVSTDRPILVSNLVFHRFWVNSPVLQRAGIGPDNVPDGVERDPDGRPNGTLLEAKGLMQVLSVFPDLVAVSEEKIRRILPLFTAGGITTACEAALGALGLETSLGTFQGLLSDPGVKLRIVGLPWAGNALGSEEMLDAFVGQVKEAATRSTDKFRIGPAKLYTDGSIISRTSPMGWPGYWDGTAEPAMQTDPQEFKRALVRFHEAGLSTVTHANSRPGCQLVLDAVAEAQARRYRPDMRHRIDHAYNITEAQLRRAKALGVEVQFFTPQIYYYGEAHLRLQGPDRASRMCPTATAKRLGVSWGFHMDPPGTPQLPWVGAWATVHRETMETGTTLGESQRVGVEDVLRAMTIEAAYQLHMDGEVGSIEMGKRADFCVLEADPLEMDTTQLKHMPVWGTVFGGELNPARTSNGG
ncbi:MAG: amidohydrolase [Deltaproteobacteria bacterium]|nr:amidohydrolase [Deltaproteobacteria bacterium]